MAAPGKARNPLVTVALGDRHAMGRLGLRATLERHGTISVIGEADTLGDLESSLDLLRPDVVVMDENLWPSIDVVVLRRELASRVVLILGDHGADQVPALIRHDIRGLVDRAGPPGDLVRAVHAVASDHAFIAPRFALSVLKFLRAGRTEVSPEACADHANLTRRETEVLHLVRKGLTNREIAQLLTVSEKTVKFHVTNLLSKLAVRSRARLIAELGSPQ